MFFAWKQGQKIKAKEYEDDQGRKIYQLEGGLFFSSVTSFKELFDIKNDPEDIVIDLAGKDIGTSIKISSVKLPENVLPTITDRDFVKATVAAPTVIKEPEKPAEAETAEGEEGVSAAEGGEQSQDASAKEGDQNKKDDKGKEATGDKKPADKKAPEKKPAEKK